MVLEHIAAILLFSGPVFYIGLWMLIDPEGIATIPEWCGRVAKKAVHCLGGSPGAFVEPEQYALSRKGRRALRITGASLVLLAILI